MEQWRKTPLNFGEILDLTFRTFKNQFAKLFTVMIILLGPITLINIIARMVGGTAFFHQSMSASSNNITSLLNHFQGSDPSFMLNNMGSDILLIFGGLVTVVLAPVAYASILVIVDDVKNGRSNRTGSVIRRAFSRYWALLGSSIVYFIFIMLMTVALVGIIVGIGFATKGPGLFPSGGITALLVILAIMGFLVIVFFATRWSFFFAAVVFEKVAPGISKSWRLTKRHFWRLLGLFIVLTLITSILSGIVNSVFNFLLGPSALLELIKGLVGMVTTSIMYVGYAIVYFDLRIRNEGEDLTEMIASFKPDHPVNLEKK